MGQAERHTGRHIGPTVAGVHAQRDLRPVLLSIQNQRVAKTFRFLNQAEIRNEHFVDRAARSHGEWLGCGTSTGSEIAGVCRHIELGRDHETRRTRLVTVGM